MTYLDNNIASNPNFYYINNSCNKQNIAFFFYSKPYYLTFSNSFNKHSNFQNWGYLCSRIYGLNKKTICYILSFLGYNKNILFTNLDESFFIFFKHLLRIKSDFFSLNWFLTYLKERTYLLPLLLKGMRYIKKLPCRGQRTHSNYNNSKKRKNIIDYFNFKKKLNNVYISRYFPGYNQIESFYFHRF